MPSKIIIITILALLLIGFSILFIIEARNHNYDYKKDWVAVYFANPGDNSLDFAIENNEGEDAEYDYKILFGNDKTIEEKVAVEAGAKQKISPALDMNNLNGAEKIMIIVSNKDAEYKIYKNIK
ncbi:MAG: hypothetical protein Q8L09_03315 [Candidatus Moranbacteria bacterium]|nr:hypothetical protein [Candidatus Moranbacteria bacterium]